MDKSKHKAYISRNLVGFLLMAYQGYVMEGRGWLYVPVTGEVRYLTSRYPTKDVKRFAEKYIPASQAVIVIENEGSPKTFSVYQIGSRKTTPKKLYDAARNIPQG